MSEALVVQLSSHHRAACFFWCLTQPRWCAAVRSGGSGTVWWVDVLRENDTQVVAAERHLNFGTRCLRTMVARTSANLSNAICGTRHSPGHCPHPQGAVQCNRGTHRRCLPLQAAVAQVVLRQVPKQIRPCDRWGRQADTCYVVCPTPEAVDRCVQEIQDECRACTHAMLGSETALVVGGAC